jgi:hypothetical protein
MYDEIGGQVMKRIRRASTVVGKKFDWEENTGIIK